MGILIITASPNADGLTASCAEAARRGAAGTDVTTAVLNKMKIGPCRACDNGWGQCRTAHECREQDDFQSLHAQVAEADGVVLVTPVYWGEMSESAKAFTDRLRRCEATRGDESALKGTPFIAVAAAGGSGNGCVSCMASLERFVDQVRARKFDLIGITRNSREYKLEAITKAASKMARGSPARS